MTHDCFGSAHRSRTFTLPRTVALVHGYGAPMQVYRQLPVESSAAPIGRQLAVCVGTEWYRFPSSFFLPGPSYRLQFIKSGFDGLLPHAFDPVAVRGCISSTLQHGRQYYYALSCGNCEQQC